MAPPGGALALLALGVLALGPAPAAPAWQDAVLAKKTVAQLRELVSPWGEVSGVSVVDEETQPKCSYCS
ncbi:hypothetical protein HPB47_026353 [Ixodes persulcatus]|uniref:Uncharacterized protein n=1 Tax=Ixodes persulcatus TaxID=34615 RepID=A0AC60Q082_IXOPE|nr:hypothetical protein HPB47_026353 [Ixodes persulcatus]